MRREDRRHNYFWGILLIIIGLLFLFQNIGYLDIGDIIRRFWPLILIAIGLKILLDHRRSSRIFGEDFRENKSGDSGSSVHSGKSGPYGSGSSSTYNNVFGDVRQRFDGKNIKSFFTNNVFGDVDLDFSKALFEEDSSLRINGIFGDVEIRVPHNIPVEVKANYMGGSSRIFDDYQSGLFKNVMYETPRSTADKPPLRIQVSILFGDVRIHS
ncbi:MAG: cell wall-active antibiotics response protein LiaF [Calditrichia bacterium]